MSGLCLITLPQSLISIPWEVVSLENATLLRAGLGKEIFACQQPIFQDLAM